MSAYSSKLIIRMLIISTMCLIVLIIGYETQLMATSDKTYQYVSAQEWASQRIVKDSLLLQYGSKEEKTQAVNEMQNMLPYFESNNAQINAAQHSDSIEVLLKSSNIDFIDIDTAAKKIVVKPDSTQLEIILDHERSYFLAYTQILSLLTEEIQNKVITIFSIIIGCKLLILGINSYLLYIVEKKIVKGD
jgi:hypothetical protein